MSTNCQPKLYRKRQLLAKIQSGCSVLEPLGAEDGKLRVEVGQDATPEVNMNERNIALRTLSKLPNVAGAVVGKMSFTSEIVGSGDLTIAPESDVELRACGNIAILLSHMDIKAPPATAEVARNAVIEGATSGATARVIVPIGPETVRVFVEVIAGTFQADESIDVVGGASGVFEVVAPAVLGGREYAPTSENFELASFRSEEDGIVKHMMNAMGTLSMSAESSGIGKFEFEFTGVVDKKALRADAGTVVGSAIAQYTYLYSGQKIILLLRQYDGTDTDGLEVPLFIPIAGTPADGDVFIDATASNGFTLTSDPIKAYFGDQAMTDGIEFFTTVPPILQDSQTKWGTFEPVFNAVSFDLGNEIISRPNANDHKGLVSGFITGRNPSGSVDPEMVSQADFDFYNGWFDGNSNELQFRFGHEEGNSVWVFIKQAQPQNVPDQDRDGLASVSYEFEAKDETAQNLEYAIVYV